MASRSLGFLAALLVCAAAAGSDPVAVAPGTSAIWGTVDGVEVEGAVGGPATQNGEALRLGVDRYAFASDLKDAGIDSPTALVAGNVVKGSLEAYRAELLLQQLGLARFERISRITVLAGPAFYETARQGIREAIASLR